MPEIKYFGEVAEKTGRTSELLEQIIQRPMELKRWLEQHHQLDMTGLKLAINHKLVDWNSDQNIHAADEIAILSPFAGG